MNATQRVAFLDRRRSYIGGTDAAAIAGLSPWASPLSVFLDKTASELPEREETLPMRRGLALERFIADEFCRAMPGLVTYHPAPQIRTDWGFPAGASLDWYVAAANKPRTPVAVLETKTAFSYVSAKQWDVDNVDLPDGYYAQVQWYLAVTGMELCYAAADTGKPQLTILPIESDTKVQDVLIETACEFWQNHVLMGVAPEPNGSDADHEALASLWPETIPDPPVSIEDELAEVILSDYLAHSLKAKQHGDEAEKAKQRLQALMGEHEAATIGGWKLTWKPVTSNRIDSKALKAEQPEIAAKYTKPSVSRRFEVKEMGG